VTVQLEDSRVGFSGSFPYPEKQTIARTQRLELFVQTLPVFDAFGQIDPQHFNLGPTDRRPANYLGIVPHEVLVPDVLTGIKQQMQLIRRRIITRNVRPLERVAVESMACDSEMIDLCGMPKLMSGCE